MLVDIVESFSSSVETLLLLAFNLLYGCNAMLLCLVDLCISRSYSCVYYFSYFNIKNKFVLTQFLFRI